MEVKKALVLDFDGTIRRGKSGKTFIEGPHDIELMPGVERLIYRYKQMGYIILGVSNQAGVAFGFKTHQQNAEEIDATQDLFAVHPAFDSILSCMHDPRGKVEPYCHRSLLRKPDIGMLVVHETTAWDHGIIIDWDNSLFVGDRPEDEECAKRAGIPFRHIDHFLTQPHTFEISA